MAESQQPNGDANVPDLTTGSPDAVYAAMEATAQPIGDVIAQVSRDVNGDPAQSTNFAVLVDDNAPQEVKDEHYNTAGEAIGAKNVGSKPDYPTIDWDQHAKTTAQELHRINFRPHEVGS